VGAALLDEDPDIGFGGFGGGVGGVCLAEDFVLGFVFCDDDDDGGVGFDWGLDGGGEFDCILEEGVGFCVLDAKAAFACACAFAKAFSALDLAASISFTFCCKSFARCCAI
jgi:hypothetical protein